MARHNLLGKKGEDEAVSYLISQGYEILQRNWIHGKAELDIIAKKLPDVVIVEVKTRTKGGLEMPCEAITESKIRRIVSAADNYIISQEIDLNVRFDIILILYSESGGYEIEHVKNAFYAPLS